MPRSPPPPTNSAVESALATGQLVRPDIQQLGLVHVVRAIATTLGVEGFDDEPQVSEVTRLIGGADHLIFILLDGLGMNILRRLPPHSFLLAHLHAQIRAVCPSTTACALTSIATGRWPSEHGVTGWFTHLPELGMTVTILPMVERFSQQPVEARGAQLSGVLPMAAFNPRIKRRTLTLLPSPITNTSYARYSRGDTPGLGYSSISDAIDKIIAYITSGGGPSYTHLYVPHIDGQCHIRGTHHPEVDALVRDIDAEIARLARSLPPGSRMIVAADHGLLDVPVAHHISLFHDDPLMALLAAPPSGDARLPIFHVHSGAGGADGAGEDFAWAFQRRWGDRMSLLSTREAEQMHLFGPSPMSPSARRHFGDFVGIALNNVTLHYVTPAVDPTPKVPYLAQHGGLSPDEMLVPLIVA